MSLLTSLSWFPLGKVGMTLSTLLFMVVKIKCDALYSKVLWEVQCKGSPEAG